MSYYLNKSGKIDLFFAVLLAVVGYFIFPYLKENEKLYQIQLHLINSLIPLGSTLLGFLLTVVTIIITFKNSYEANNEKQTEVDYVEQGTTIFDRKVNKEKLFYGTPLHSFVTKVFLSAIIEIGLALGILILLHFFLHKDLLNYSLPIVVGVLLLILVSMFKSLYIFKLFLNIHS